MFNLPIILCASFGLVIIVLLVIIFTSSSSVKDKDTENTGLTKTVNQQKKLVDDLTKRVKTIQTQNEQLTKENEKYNKECNIASLIRKKEGLILKDGTAFFRNRMFTSGSDANQFCQLAGYTGLQKKANYNTEYSSCDPGDSWFKPGETDKGDSNIYNSYYLGYYNKDCGDSVSVGWTRASAGIDPLEAPGYAACDATTIIPKE